MKIMLALFLSSLLLATEAKAKLYFIGTPGKDQILTQVICEDNKKFLLVLTDKGTVALQIHTGSHAGLTSLRCT